MPLSCLATLPIEILEQICLHLPGQDIIKMKAINRHLRDIVRASPILQHRCELFAVGLIDNPFNSCDLAERRQRCEGYAHKWSGAASLAKSTHKLPVNQSTSCWANAQYFGNGLLVSRSTEDNSLTFLHIPSAASQNPIESWVISPVSFVIWRYATHPPEEVIAIAEWEERREFLRIHFLNLRDGSPHPSPLSDVITWELPAGTKSLLPTDGMTMTSSRLMMRFLCKSKDYILRVVVWNWKTGDTVLEFSSTDESGLLKGNNLTTFLNEFRVAVIPNMSAATELAVFDTLVPRDRPGYLKRLEFPPEFRDKPVKIRVDGHFGTPNKDEVFLADPAQAVVVIEFGGGRKPPDLLVVPMRVLIEQTHSEHAGSRVPWDEWGRDAVVIEPNDDNYRLSTIVHGAQVMIVCASLPYAFGQPQRGGFRVYTFDFSQRGRSSLPLHSGIDGIRRVLLLEGGTDVRFESDDDMNRWDRLRSLRDGSLFHMGTRYGESLDDTLRILELR